MTLNCVFCPKPNDSLFTHIHDKQKQQILELKKKLEPANVQVLLEKWWNRLIDGQIRWRSLFLWSTGEHTLGNAIKNGNRSTLTKKLPVCDSWTSYCYLLRSQHYHTVSYTFSVHKPLTMFFFSPVYMLQISQNQPGLFGPSRSCLTTHVVCKPERLKDSRLRDRKVWKSDPRTSKVMWCGCGVSKLTNNILLRLRKWKSFPALIVQKRSDLAVHVLSLHYN